MTAKKPWRVRASTIALILMIPLTIGYGVIENFHLGEWMMAFGLAGLFGLMLVLLLSDDLPVIGDRSIG